MRVRDKHLPSWKERKKDYIRGRQGVVPSQGKYLFVCGGVRERGREREKERKKLKISSTSIYLR